MTFPFGEQVTLHRRELQPGADQYGNDVYTDADSVVTGCVFAPAGSTETLQGQNTVVDQPTLYVPTSVDVEAVDAITVRGVRYEVDGTPVRFTSPWTGWTPPTVVRLKGVTG